MKHVWRLWILTQLFFQFGPWHESFDPIRVTLNWPTGPKVLCPCLPQSLLFSMYCEGLFVCELIQNPVSGRTLQGSACPTEQLLFPTSFSFCSKQKCACGNAAFFSLYRKSLFDQSYETLSRGHAIETRNSLFRSHRPSPNSTQGVVYSKIQRLNLNYTM